MEVRSGMSRYDTTKYVLASFLERCDLGTHIFGGVSPGGSSRGSNPIVALNLETLGTP